MTPEVKERIEQIRHGNVPEGYWKTAHGIAPNEWKQKPLVEVVDFLDDQRIPIKENERQSGQFPYYGASGIIDYVEDYIFDGEYILLGEDGANILDRSSPLAFRVSGKCWINNHAHVLRPKSGYHIDYLTNYLESLSYVKYNSGSAQPKLNQDTCQKLPVVCGRYSEQEKIADIFSTQDKTIILKERLLAEKQRQKKYLMQQLLTGKKRLPGFEGEWKQDKLGKLFAERSETKCEHLELLAITGTQGVIPRSQLDLKDNSSEDKSKYLRICVGDIGYNTMRMWQGVSAYSNYEGIVSPAYTILKPNSMINAKYFAYLFKMPDVVFMFYRFSQGLVDDTRNLKYENFKKISVTYPADIEEQNAIVAVLEKADQEIELIRQSIEQEKQKKKALMQLLLTGIVRVTTDK